MRPIEVHVHVHLPPDPRLDQILNALNALKQQESTMAVSLDNLTAELTNNTSVTSSVLALIQTLAAAEDPAALQALVDTLAANDAAVAAAVAANTPAAPVDAPPAA